MFPTMEQVEAASRYQLCYWHRFLPSATTPETQAIQRRAYERYQEVGGFTPEISKSIGWDQR